MGRRRISSWTATSRSRVPCGRSSARNPHSFVNVEVAEEGGAAVVWRCELNSIASIRRAGIDENTFTPGARVRLTGHPARHGEHECYFRTAEFADGRVVSQGQVPPTALPQATAPAIEQTQIFGTWARKVVAAGGVAGPGMMQFLTPAGRAASAAYDAYRDDPARHCSPVSPQRLWGNPVQPVEITRDGRPHRASLRVHGCRARRCTLNRPCAAHGCAAHRARRLVRPLRR